MWRALGVVPLLLLTLQLCQGAGEDGSGFASGFGPDVQQFCTQFNSSCRECIAASTACVWCPSLPAVATVIVPRCRSRTEGLTCEGVIQDPEPLFNIIEDEDFSRTQQVRPQRVELQLRRGQPMSFNIMVRPAEDFPLDFYILMDLSASLSNRLGELQASLNDIIEVLTDLSSQFALGFGTFVDKRTLPYTLETYMERNSITDVLQCANERPECVDAYSYHHLLSLSNQTDTIVAAIENAEISASVDNAEGGLDALLQAVLCTDTIGWRQNSLHLLMFITDAAYHVAGDGRLGGIVRPNDGQCHLERNEDDDLYEYLLDTVYDYPSVDQVAIALRDGQIVPIFTIPDNRLDTYNNLRDRVNTITTALAASLSSTPEIIGIIEESYRNVTQEVVFNPPDIEGIRFEFEPIEGCPVENRTEGGGCRDVEFNQTVVFRVTVTLDSCEGMTGETIETAINMIGFGATAIRLTPQCRCDCEDEVVTNSQICSSNGSLVCGLCECSVGRLGTFCQCDEASSAETCPVDNGLQCSGPTRGECDECNTCICRADPTNTFNFFGVACECDNTSCMIGSNGLQCSGPDRGSCDCNSGECICVTDPISGFPFFGEDCSCDPSECFNEAFPGRRCVTPGQNDSECLCGGCNCTGLFIRDNNGTCQLRADVCDDNEECARCVKGEAASDTDCGACNAVEIPRGFRLPGAYSVSCSFTDGDSCVHLYFVAQANDSLPVLVQEGRDCPADNLLWIILGSIIGGILILGALILAIIKLILIVLDRIEYQKFTKGLQEAEWAPHENPLYVNPQQDYKNVAYRKRSARTAQIPVQAAQ